MMQHVVKAGTGTAARYRASRWPARPARRRSAQRDEPGLVHRVRAGDNPKIAIAVTIERTQGKGGTVAAPIAKQVMRGAAERAAMAEVAENTVVDGRYRILSRIGSGGMADVYCAQDTHLGRQVALKVLHRRFAQDQEFVERFRREASAAAGLQHPNVVDVFDRGEYDGTYYIAMEYLRGPHAQGPDQAGGAARPEARDRPRRPDPARRRLRATAAA